MINLFHEHFQVVVANTPKLRKEVFKIRYRVFCQELNYERKSNHQDGMEQDIYDQRSIHCLLLHRASQQYAGCVRLIMADPSSQASLPFEQVCRYSLSSCHSPQSYFCELSRLAVAVKFRQRLGYQPRAELTVEGSYSAQAEERLYPLIVPGLYLAAISLALDVGLDAIYALMQPRLASYLQQFGIRLRPIGELEEVHGQRRLFEISREAALSSINASTYEVFQKLRSDIRKSWLQADADLSTVSLNLHYGRTRSQTGLQKLEGQMTR